MSKETGLRNHLASREQINKTTAAIVEEVFRAEEKFPGWPTDIVHGVAIMAEEAGEAVKAALQVHYQGLLPYAYREELIQTAAMCVRAFIDLDHYERVVRSGPGFACEEVKR